MPEFRRGWGRWLPRAAERDLFHPSLEDLRAEGRRGIRLQVAIAALWLDCWRVWAVSSNPPKGGHHQDGQHQDRHQHRDPAFRWGITDREYAAMFFQDVRRALRLFRM